MAGRRSKPPIRSKLHSRADLIKLKHLTLPNLLSSSRYLLALPMAYLTWSGAFLEAAIVLWLAIATDIADGQIARRRNQTSALGGLLDHSSDAFFVALLLFALALRDLVPIVLPCLVLAAFTQYALDSRALKGQALRSSQLGRYNGIAYFVLGGFPVMQHALGIYLLKEPWFFYLGWGLVITTLISMVDRLVTLLFPRPEPPQDS